MANWGDVRRIARAIPLFTEPHYNRFPAVLVRLAAITPAQLRSLLVEAWRSQAPAGLGKNIPQSRTEPASRTGTRRKKASRKV